MDKINNVVRVPCKSRTDFFRYWLLFLRPYHKLTEREIDVATAFLMHYYELEKIINDKGILNKVVMSEDIKKKIMEDCSISMPHFQVILGKLRKSKIIINNQLNPRFLPNIKEGGPTFNLLLTFNFPDV